MSIGMDKYSKYIMKKAAEHKIPLTGAFELTSRCNFNCKMCFVNHSIYDRDALSGELTADEIIGLAGEARDAGVLYLVLTGGEALVRKDFKIIYKEIAQMGFSLRLLTNCSLVDRETADFFASYAPAGVSTTIYGASPETYKRITGSAAGFEHTLQGIDMLLARGVEVEIKLTVIQDNYGEFWEIMKIINRFEEKYKKPIKFAFTDYISPRRDGCSNQSDTVRLTAEQIGRLESEVYAYNQKRIAQAGTTGMAIAKDSEDPLADAVAGTEYSADPSSAFTCWVGKCAFWLTWDGMLSPCGMLTEPAANPLKDGFLNAWRRVNEEVMKTPVNHKCRNCEHVELCNPCPARFYAETGTFTDNPAYFCKCTQERIKNFAAFR
jgi:Predicted Fe-S oxidoreductases